MLPSYALLCSPLLSVVAHIYSCDLLGPDKLVQKLRLHIELRERNTVPPSVRMLPPGRSSSPISLANVKASLKSVPLPPRCRQAILLLEDRHSSCYIGLRCHCTGSMVDVRNGPVWQFGHQSCTGITCRGLRAYISMICRFGVLTSLLFTASDHPDRLPGVLQSPACLPSALRLPHYIPAM